MVTDDWWKRNRSSPAPDAALLRRRDARPDGRPREESSAEFWTLMTDYYPVISRRIAGLKDNTAESRRALYQRVETVLVEQLRELDPPLEEPEILRERLSLEDAVRRVEADAERRVVDRPGESTPARRRFPRTRVAAFDGAFVATGIEAPRLVPGSEDTDPRGLHWTVQRRPRRMPTVAGAGADSST